MLIAILAYRPIYKSMYEAVNLEEKQLVANGVSFNRSSTAHETFAGDSLITFHTQKSFTDGTIMKKDSIIHWSSAGPVMHEGKPVEPTLKTSITLADNTRWHLVFLIFLQVIFVTMVYGPIAAFLVEMFPVRIRYTSMSLPYHIGNGVFGGLLPAVATYLVSNAKAAGHAEWYLEGLWYPIVIGAVCFVIGMLYIRERHGEADK